MYFILRLTIIYRIFGLFVGIACVNFGGILRGYLNWMAARNTYQYCSSLIQLLYKEMFTYYCLTLLHDV